MAKSDKDEATADGGKVKRPGKGDQITRGRFDFMGSRNTGYLISAVLIALSCLSMATRGLNWGIDFRGGSVYRYRFMDAKKATLPAVKALADSPEMKKLLGDVTVQSINPGDTAVPGSAEFLVSMTFTEKDAKDDPIPQLERRFQDLGDFKQLSANEVGPTIGATIKANAAKALLLAVLGMLAYIAMRFEPQWGVAAVLALVHDCVIVIGIFSFTQRSITSDSLAALLTIIGYSLNDTIVIIDRVRENLSVATIKRKLGYEGVFNLSVNQSLSRTLNTSVTTLFPVVSLLLFGGLVIRDFALALFLGVIAGTYSSIWVVSALLVDRYYKEHPGMREKDRAKSEAAAED